MPIFQLSNSDVIALVAAFVASLALIATIWQAALARKHNRLSVRPHLDWFRERTPGALPAIMIVNHGLGPAILESTFLEFEGTLEELGKRELPAAIQNEIDKASFFVEWDLFTPETPFKVSHEVAIFRCRDPRSGGQLDHTAAVQFLDRIGVRIRYRSMYGERFTLDCSPER